MHLYTCTHTARVFKFKHCFSCLKFSQWKEQRVFRSIKQNNLRKFTVFGIKKNIKEVLLKKELDYTIISSSDKFIIYHVKNSLLSNNKETCIKGEIGLFDASVGPYDVAEECEEVGNSLLPQL